MRRTIAVLIPAYNARDFLVEALESVRAQTRPPDEVVVVDDGSTDGTADLARAWCADRGGDIPLSVLSQANQGAAAARNLGIRSVSTDLIALLDADDVFLPRHLERCAGAFERAPGVVLCFADAEIFTSSGVMRPSLLAGTRIANVPSEPQADGLRVMTESAFTSLLWGSYVPTATTVFLRSAGLRAGLYDEHILPTADREFLLRLSRLGRFAYYPEVLARKREHAANMTRPSRALECERDRFVALEKMRIVGHRLRLSDAERVAVDRALADQVWDMQYTASIGGLRTYLATCLFLVRHGVVGPLFRPRHMARALLHTA